MTSRGRYSKRYIPDRPTKRQYHPDFARYESEKRAWALANPDSTDEQYNYAVKEIARRCGI